MTLKSYLASKGITVTAFARTLNVSKGFVSDLANGKRLCSLEMAVRIERLTKGRVSCRDLVAGPAR